MTIQIDSREHKWELARIQRQLTALGCKTIVSKLYVGDYQSLDNPRLVIDRKKDLLELCGNVTQQHERFQRELTKAQEAGIRLIILIEHGGDIQSLEDVYFWDNPRLLQSPKPQQARGCINRSARFEAAIMSGLNFARSKRRERKSWSC